MAFQTKVTVGGVDISSYTLSYASERTWGDAVAQAEIKVKKTINAILTLATGQTVLIQRGWTLPTDETIFQGAVESYNPEGGTIKLICKDKAWDLVKRDVNTIYKSSDAFAGKISAIFLDLVTTYGGLTADGTTVQDSGTTTILDKFVCTHTDVMDRCKKLAEILDWQFYYRPDTDKVYFEPKGFTTNSTVLTVGGNVQNVPTWNYDNTEMCNDLYVIGAYQEIETTESGQIGVTSGYTTTSVQLSFTPLSVKIYNDNSNPPTTLKVGGMPDSTSSYDYYVDKEKKQILPAPSTTFANNSYMEIRYSHAVPIPVHLYNQASIDSYKISTKTITLTDLRSVADAETRGNNYLSVYAQPFVYSTLNLKSASTNNVKVGDIVQVVDSISTPNVNENMVINRHTIRYPADYEECYVGAQYWRLAAWQASVEERLKRLQEDQLANQDVIVEVLTVDNATYSPIQALPRYRKILQKSVSGNVFIFGHPTYGIIGTSIIGDLAAEATGFVQQYQNSYTETFADIDFDNTGATTATGWGTGTLSFTNGQIGQSLSVDYNNSTITSVKLTASSSTNLLFYVCANGSTWELTTSGATHAFAVTGSDLRWKATASGNASLTSLKLEAYH